MWLKTFAFMIHAFSLANSCDLKLLKTIPLEALKNTQRIAPQIDSNKVYFPDSNQGGVVHNAFGYVWHESRYVIYTGFNGMAADIENGVVSQLFPTDLTSVKISPSGDWMIGLRHNERTLWSMHKGIVREQVAGRWTWFMKLGWFHPSDTAFFAPDEATRYPYQPTDSRASWL